ncbi:transglutaminase TgpA family protein [Arhodomonas sp. AD133]|uniref:transglutaminase TgpA family protein n=1 Tax=Arhodomonas sp. AD133 TaxID=3415009 RepID=UPI003EBA18FA
MRDTRAVDRRSLLWALIVAAAVLAPHLLRLPPALTAGIALVLAWRLAAGFRGLRLPGRWLLTALTAGGVALVFGHYGTIVGPAAGVALLALMTSLKLLELRGRRDLRVIVYLAFFLVLTQFIFSQSLLMAAYLLIVSWMGVALLVAANRPTGEGLTAADGRTAGSLMLQALPIMAILFVLFPRLPGPLWALPEPEGAGVTGLSDRMSPGSISQLSESDAVAFRVRFDDEVPPREARYWRGPVLDAYDGTTWTRGARDAEPPRVSVSGTPVDYELTLKPHAKRWLLALDLPVNVDGAATRTDAYEYLASTPVHELRRYQGRSYGDYRLQPDLSGEARRRYTSLPDRQHPRARALARRLSNGRTPSATIDATIEWLRARAFVYTLRPGAIEGDTVDRFLFETRRGFCEHYAGAFAVLMRAAGIPARVVTGYLGGERNPGTDYFVVRQSDAHAWVEVWTGETGWQRIDPTAAVAPARVSGGLGAAVPESDPVPLMARGTPGMARELRLLWDRMDAMWNNWVLAYGPQLQRDLLGNLGLRGALEIALATAAALAVSLLVLAVWTLRPGRAIARDPVQRVWQRYCRRLAAVGLEPGPSDGPHTLLARVRRDRPDLADAAAAITDLYVRLRYRSEGGTPERRALRRQVRRFRPRRRRMPRRWQGPRQPPPA